MRENKNAYCVMMGKPEGKRLLGRPQYRQEYDMKLILKYDWKVWSRIMWLRVKVDSGSYKYGN